MPTEQHATDPKTMLPLTHLSHHIMLAVLEGALHGYAISKRVAELSHGRIKPGTGTFYSAIRRMLAESVLTEVDQPEDSGSQDSRRRYYELTRFGREVLTAEGRRLAELVALTSPQPGIVG